MWILNISPAKIRLKIAKIYFILYLHYIQIREREQRVLWSIILAYYYSITLFAIDFFRGKIQSFVVVYIYIYILTTTTTQRRFVCVCVFRFESELWNFVL